MRRNPKQLALAASLVAAALAIALAVPAEATPTVDASTSRDSTTPGPVAISGIVKAGGSATSAEVVATLWPNQKTMAGIGPGDSVPTLSIAQATTDARGTYTLRLDPATIPAEYKNPDGVVDVQLLVAAGTSMMTWNLSIQAGAAAAGAKSMSGASSAWKAASDESEASKTPMVDFDIQTGTVTDHSDLGERVDTAGNLLPPQQFVKAGVMPRNAAFDRAASSAKTAAATSAAGQGAQAKVVAAAVIPGCSWLRDKSAAGTKYGVTEAFTRVQGAKGIPVTLIQTTSSHHQIGVAAVSPKGIFSANGTKTITTGSSSSHGYETARIVNNRVNYGRYTLYCAGNLGQSLGSEWRPISMHSLNVSAQQVARYTSTSAKKCQGYASGTYSKIKAANTTMTGGVSLGGIKLNAQAGWDTDTKMVWTFHARGRLCGTTDSGWSSSPWAYVVPGW